MCAVTSETVIAVAVMQHSICTVAASHTKVETKTITVTHVFIGAETKYEWDTPVEECDCWKSQLLLH